MTNSAGDSGSGKALHGGTHRQVSVRRYLHAESGNALLAGGVQVSVLDSFKPYLNGRLAGGERNATLLLAEITGQGYTGGYNTLNRYLRPLRRLEAAALAELPPRPTPPPVRKVTGWITGLPSNLDPDAAERLQRSAPAAPRWTPLSGTWPGSPG